MAGQVDGNGPVRVPECRDLRRKALFANRVGVQHHKRKAIGAIIVKGCSAMGCVEKLFFHMFPRVACRPRRRPGSDGDGRRTCS
ncbi:hypothetical protein [Agrobacterium sp. P15N1-A]|uniref:hypothetical protein n=1 Tax=Agrobacterium sp. P15N1-A TaxID=3342820 RepID=UPI0037DCF3B7